MNIINVEHWTALSLSSWSFSHFSLSSIWWPIYHVSRLLLKNHRCPTPSSRTLHIYVEFSGHLVIVNAYLSPWSIVSVAPWTTYEGPFEGKGLRAGGGEALLVTNDPKLFFSPPLPRNDVFRRPLRLVPFNVSVFLTFFPLSILLSPKSFMP